MQIKKFEKNSAFIFIAYHPHSVILERITHVYIFALGIVPVSSIKQLILCKVKHVYKLP